MPEAVTIAVARAAPSRIGDQLRVIARNVFPFLVVGAIWEIVARSGMFPRKLFPTLEEIARSFVDLTVSGILPHHALRHRDAPARRLQPSPPSSGSRSAC